MRVLQSPPLSPGPSTQWNPGCSAHHPQFVPTHAGVVHSGGADQHMPMGPAGVCLRVPLPGTGLHEQRGQLVSLVSSVAAAETQVMTEAAPPAAAAAEILRSQFSGLATVVGWDAAQLAAFLATMGLSDEAAARHPPSQAGAGGDRDGAPASGCIQPEAATTGSTASAVASPFPSQGLPLAANTAGVPDVHLPPAGSALPVGPGTVSLAQGNPASDRLAEGSCLPREVPSLACGFVSMQCSAEPLAGHPSLHVPAATGPQPLAGSTEGTGTPGPIHWQPAQAAECSNPLLSSSLSTGSSGAASGDGWSGAPSHLLRAGDTDGASSGYPWGGSRLFTWGVGRAASAAEAAWRYSSSASSCQWASDSRGSGDAPPSPGRAVLALLESGSGTPAGSW